MAVDPKRDALIVVDLQPDFMPGGPLAVAEGDRIAAPIGRLAASFSTVVATQDWHPGGHVSFSRARRTVAAALPGGERRRRPARRAAGRAGYVKVT